MTTFNFLRKIGNLLLLLLVSDLFYRANSYLIGIDLGTEYFKATILKPGKPFTMMENIQSKTKTPTAVAFKDNERVFGADAIMKKPRIPKQALVYFHEYLGKSLKEEEIKTFIKEFFVSYDFQEDTERNTIDIKINFNNDEFKLNIEEIFGMLFRYIKYLADKFTNSDIKDCVITVPNFFGYKERHAISQAVQMSKLNLLGLVSENVGAVVQYSINKQFNTTQNYIFYNMGSSFTQATLVSYTSNMQTKNNKTSEVSKVIKVLGESWEKNLGGNVFNYKIVRNLMQKFDALKSRAGKPSVQNDYRVAERILPNANKYKEILSSNKETPVYILNVESGMNLESKITREEFEKSIEEEMERVYNPIEKLLNKTGLTLDQIEQIELLGGSVRVPRVQEVLKQKLGSYSNLLGQHMNGDDSMALGTAFICANFSSNFKGGKKLELYHGPNYDLVLKLDNISPEEVNQPECEENKEDFAVDCVRKLQKTRTLFNIRTDLNKARTVGFKHDGDIVASLYEKFEDSTEEKFLVKYKITGIQNILNEMKNENVTSNPKINLRFKQDSSGLVTLKADLVYNIYLYLSMQEGPSGGIEYIFTPKQADPLPSEEIQKIEEELKTANLTEAQKSALQMKKEVGKEKKQEVKKDLSIDVEYSDPKPLTQTQIEEAKAKLNKFDQIDEDRIKTMEKRNSLEAMIYSKKEWMESDESKKYSKDNELETAEAAHKEIYDWYEDNSFRSDYKVLSEKYNELLDTFKHFDERVSNHKKLAQAIENFENTMKKIKEDAEKLIKSKPWTSEYYNSTFLKEFNIVSSWFQEKREAQDKLPLFEVILQIYYF